VEIEKIGEDLFKVKFPWWGSATTKNLTRALLEVQEGGKVVTSFIRTSVLPETYLITTTSK